MSNYCYIRKLDNLELDLEGKQCEVQSLFKVHTEKGEVHMKQDVLNLFSRKSTIVPETYEVPEMPDIYRSLHQNDEEIHRREKVDLLKQLERFNDNVKHAILLRTEKDNKSEFYRKLETLTERIHIYKNIFYARQPKFAKNNKKFERKKKVAVALNSPIRKV